ncbi:LytR/AlgR family response regulator transcription factor [Elongatibacter sediminis]|uniref:LytTR family DNA-binding domain-containing protein n=1 Tax=Elongatibacter sediminis TaxID=3119006 RepID=A0AAW9REK4_9GAMM
MSSILIVDDEAPARDRLRRMLEKLPAYVIVGEAATGNQAMDAIIDLQPDIVLLDISMPGMDGMSLARALQRGGVQPAIIFCTAFQNQALDAFEAEAVDYLVKPVRAERLSQALERARRYIGDRANSEVEYLRSTVGGKVLLTPIHRVICLMAEDKYTTVLHEKGKTVIDDSLTVLEQRFPDAFFRIHRNALVSRRHVRGLERSPEGHAVVVLSGTDERPEVSRRNVSALRKLLVEL